MNKLNITMLVIHIRAAAMYAHAAGMIERADWFNAVAASIEDKYSEYFVK